MEEDSENEGKLETIEEDTTLEVKQEEDSEHEGMLENVGDKMEKKKVTIPVFDGENYNMWKKRIEMFLKFKKCATVITRAKTANDKDDWEDQDLKAINLIYSSLSDEQLEFACDLKSAYEIIKKFDGMYLKESTTLQIVCRNRLEKMRLANSCDSALFLGEFVKTVNELKSAGAKVSENEKLNYMLNTLPESYSYIGDLIDTLKEADQTADYIRNKIKLAEMKNQGEYGEKSTNAFTAKKKDVSNVENLDISPERAKMAAKRDSKAAHGESRQVVATEAEEEGATAAEGAATSASMEKSRAARTRAHG